MNIGDRIRKRREELGMSQDELARSAGYKSRSSINKIEVDGRGLPQPKVVAIANALRVTPAYLMGWETESDTYIDEKKRCRAIDLEPIEEELLSKIRMLPKGKQHMLMTVVDALLEDVKEE